MSPVHFVATPKPLLLILMQAIQLPPCSSYRHCLPLCNGGAGDADHPSVGNPTSPTQDEHHTGPCQRYVTDRANVFI
ncbi:hypothetical protein J3E72DRAFT_300439 [Bipolaris maydis]|uniref:uncharacterized protein n=1 Tax=Cochliobolus heterostrophus TaxID=5016 RepID=UPI0024D97CDF|nr:hypothetical protein J3E73DRAFT_361135 [Bipolaris maydis]KAJ5030676.1 hypothetical protein J3E73DRAFT_278869 [Bipolaris maydis]KAJ5065690.1 hypothetical protein J3E74DRAFT_304102 [Bipolaris maydis]KAJ6200894.1 hypothetical protein J3E72DRAFT_300439 [Bipolaris maydis]KAJ6213251.1 hypothetical protein PSV09DRAFT_2275421 [Bipolaris maydis]